MPPKKATKQAANATGENHSQAKAAPKEEPVEPKPKETSEDADIPEQLSSQMELVLQWSSQVMESKKNLNHILGLLKLADSKHDRVVITSLLRLREIFLSLYQSGDIPAETSTKRQKREDGNSTSAILTSWLQKTVNSVFELCLKHVHRLSSPGVQSAAVQTLMRLCQPYQRDPTDRNFKLKSLPIHDLTRSLLMSINVHESTINIFMADFSKYADISYEILCEICEMSPNENGNNNPDLLPPNDPIVATRIYKVLKELKPMKGLSDTSSFFVGPSPKTKLKANDSKSLWDTLKDPKTEFDPFEPGAKNKTAKKKRPLSSLAIADPAVDFFKMYHTQSTSAWLSFLKRPLPIDLYKVILSEIHECVIPRFPSPLALFDFLVNSYNIGGVASLLSLHGLFVLMTKHNLNYPDFYQRLYALLTPSVLRVKYRSKFFKLLSTFLASSYVPSYMIAAFAKRLARLTLTAPPSGCLIVIPFIYNLLVQHQACRKLLHQEREEQEGNYEGEPAETANDESNTSGVLEKLERDPYNHEEIDPVKSNAINSSLWELATLSKHYCPPVSRVVKLLEKSFKKNEKYNLDDFLEQTHSTIFEGELRRKLKATPALTFKKPTALFEPKEVSADFGFWEIPQGAELPTQNTKK